MRIYLSKEIAMGVIKGFSIQNGMKNVQYAYDIEDIGIVVKASGVKMLSDRWFTYEVIMYISPRSILSLTVGHLSENYPSAEIISFVSSVSKR